MVYLYIILFLDFVLLLFSKILYIHFNSDIISTFSPVIPYVLFYGLLLFILLRFIVKKSKGMEDMTDKIFIIGSVIFLSLFPFHIGWWSIGEGFYIGHIKREVKYLDNQVIMLMNVPYNTFSNPYILVGNSLEFGFMQIHSVYDKYQDCERFEYYYKQMDIEQEE